MSGRYDMFCNSGPRAEWDGERNRVERQLVIVFNITVVVVVVVVVVAVVVVGGVVVIDIVVNVIVVVVVC